MRRQGTTILLVNLGWRGGSCVAFLCRLLPFLICTTDINDSDCVAASGAERLIQVPDVAIVEKENGAVHRFVDSSDRGSGLAIRRSRNNDDTVGRLAACSQYIAAFAVFKGHIIPEYGKTILQSHCYNWANARLVKKPHFHRSTFCGKRINPYKRYTLFSSKARGPHCAYFTHFFKGGSFVFCRILRILAIERIIRQRCPLPASYMYAS